MKNLLGTLVALALLAVATPTLHATVYDGHTPAGALSYIGPAAPTITDNLNGTATVSFVGSGTMDVYDTYPNLLNGQGYLRANGSMLGAPATFTVHGNSYQIEALVANLPCPYLVSSPVAGTAYDVVIIIGGVIKFTLGPAIMPVIKAPRTLTVSGPPSGYVGTAYPFTASVNHGGGTITWSATGPHTPPDGGTGPSATYNWSAPNPSYTVTATITPDPNYLAASGSTVINIQALPTYSITAVNVSPAGAATAGCTASASPSSNIPQNSFTTLTATPAPGWQFISWTLSGTADQPANTPSASLTHIQSNCTVTANFTALPVSGSISVSPTSAIYTAPGAATTVTWTTSNATSVSVSGAGVSSSAASGSPYVSGLGVGTYTYTLNASGPGGSITPKTATFTVNPKPVTFTFGSLSQTYGGSTKTATVSCSDSSATYTTDLTKGPSAGSYTVSASANGNYTGSGSATLTITQATQTAPTVSLATTGWAGTAYTPTASGGGGFGSLQWSPDNATWTGTPPTFSTVGTWTAYARWSGDTNHSASPSGSATITISALTPVNITANPQSVTYGAAVPTLTYTASPAAGVSSVPLSTTYTAGANVGTYPISIGSPTYNTGYTAGTRTNGTVTVNAKPVTFTFGSLSPTYDGSNKTATVSCSDSSATFATDLTKGPNAGSYTVSASAYGNYTGSGSATLTIQKADQTIIFGGLANKTYLDVPFAVSATATSGLPVAFSVVSGPATVNGSTVTLTGAGTVTIRASQSGNGNYNSAPNVDQTFTVAKAPQPALTLNATTPQTYGAAQTLTITGGGGAGAVSYAITGQSVAGVATLAGAALTANAGVGWVDLQATKAGDANYLSATSATVRVTFAPKTVTPSVTVASKTYDGTTVATITGRTLTGVLGADDVTLAGGAAVFASKTVGTGKTVTATGLALAGAAAGNYTLATTTATTTASITAKNLTVAGVTANAKVYDGGTAATLNLGGASLVGVVAGDTVTLNTGGATGVFGDKTVGTGKTVTVSGLALAGADAGNYSLTQPTTTADITAKSVVNGFTVVTASITANDKTYDGTTAASLNLGSAALSGAIAGDAVSLVTSGASGAFGDKNVGTSKTVTVSGLTLSGADAGNYSLTPQPTTTANITPAPPTITWLTPAAITYGTPLSETQLDATASVPGVLTYTPASGTLLNAGAGQTLRVDFMPTDSVNYTATSATTTLTVNKADQTVTLTPLVSAVPLGTPIAYTAAGGATGVYVWGGTAGVSGGGTTQTVTPAGGLGSFTVTVYAPGNSNYNDSPPVTATFTAQAQTLALSLTPLVSNYTVDNASSPLNGKTYKRVWQDGGAWHAYLGRSGDQFQIVGQATTAVQSFELQALEPNADPSAWYSLATIAPPTGVPNGPGVGVTGVFSVSLDTGSAAAALVPQSYAQGSPKTGVWQLRARTQDSSGTWSDWANVVAVTVDLPLTTTSIPAQSLPPAGPIGGWFTASDQTTFNLPVWIP